MVTYSFAVLGNLSVRRNLVSTVWESSAAIRGKSTEDSVSECPN